jgi:hypothetical protein
MHDVIKILTNIRKVRVSRSFLKAMGDAKATIVVDGFRV